MSNHCVSCGQKEFLRKVLDFGSLPLTDVYSATKELSLTLPKKSLALNLCSNCSHLQLVTFHEMSEVYTNYIYNSSITVGLNKTFRNYAEYLKLICRKKSPSVLDIGSNDGSFGEAVISLGMEFCGIEPGVELSSIANSRNVKTINGFLEDDSVQREIGNKKFDIITFNNVFANLSDPLQALNLAKQHLTDNGYLVVQTGYHPIQFTKGQFDYIYHEHFSYFTVNSMKKIASRSKMNVVGCHFLSTRAGSARFILQKEEVANFSLEIPPFDLAFSDEKKLKNLKKRINSNNVYIREKILDLDSLILYGASHSTGILVHVLGLTKKITKIVDDNELKWGLFSPVEKLKVQSPRDILDVGSAIVVVGAWQHFGDIEKKLIKMGVKKENIIHPFEL